MVPKEKAESCKCLENQNCLCLTATYSSTFEKLQATHKLLLFGKLRLATIQNWNIFFSSELKIFAQEYWTDRDTESEAGSKANVQNQNRHASVFEIALDKVWEVLTCYWEICLKLDSWVVPDLGLGKDVFSLVRQTAFSCFLAGFNCFSSEWLPKVHRITVAHFCSQILCICKGTKFWQLSVFASLPRYALQLLVVISFYFFFN